MRIRRLALLLLPLLPIFAWLPLREAPAKEEPKTALPGAGLPAGWNGSWKGEARVDRAGQKPLAFTMELHIAPI